MQTWIDSLVSQKRRYFLAPLVYLLTTLARTGHQVLRVRGKRKDQMEQVALTVSLEQMSGFDSL
jgi:hypothetical protein